MWACSLHLPWWLHLADVLGRFHSWWEMMLHVISSQEWGWVSEFESPVWETPCSPLAFPLSSQFLLFLETSKLVCRDLFHGQAASMLPSAAHPFLLLFCLMPFPQSRDCKVDTPHRGKEPELRVVLQCVRPGSGPGVHRLLLLCCSSPPLTLWPRGFSFSVDKSGERQLQRPAVLPEPPWALTRRDTFFSFSEVLSWSRLKSSSRKVNLAFTCCQLFTLLSLMVGLLQMARHLRTKSFLLLTLSS